MRENSLLLIKFQHLTPNNINKQQNIIGHGFYFHNKNQNVNKQDPTTQEQEYQHVNLAHRVPLV